MQEIVVSAMDAISMGFIVYVMKCVVQIKRENAFVFVVRMIRM